MGRVADSKRARGTRSAAAYALAALLLTACAALEGGPAASTSHEVVGYYPGWVAPRFAPTPEHIAARNLTVVNYAFLDICWRGRHGNPAEGGMRDCSAAAAAPASDPSPDAVSAAAASTAAVPPDGALVLGAPELDAVPGLDNLAQLVRLKESNPRLRLMASVGGWTWSNRFSDMAASAATRRNFIDSSIAFLRGRQFDGIDIDWEYPTAAGIACTAGETCSRAEDKRNFVLLARELRAAFDAAGAVDGKHYLVTIAAGADRRYVEDALTGNAWLAELARSLDWINLMTYDYHNTTAALAAHVAPLRFDARDPSSDAIDAHVEATVRMFRAAGVPAQQLVLGVPFYGYGWAGCPGGRRSDGLYQICTGPAAGSQGPNFEFDFLVDQGYLALDATGKFTVAGRGFTRYWNDAASTPYLYNATTRVFISYDDEESIARKMRFLKAQGLRGAMFWQIEGDRGGVLQNVIKQTLAGAPAE